MKKSTKIDDYICTSHHVILEGTLLYLYEKNRGKKMLNRCDQKHLLKGFNSILMNFCVQMYDNTILLPDKTIKILLMLW